MRKFRRKMNNVHGFSLVELLVATLILSMVSAVVAGGIPVAKEAYEKVTLSANAQVMLSTTISALRNELCTATQVTIGDGSTSGEDSSGGTISEGEGDGTQETTIRYYSSAIKNFSTLSIGKVDTDSAQDSILLTQYADYSGTSTARNLVSSAVGDKKLFVVYSAVAYDDGIVTFTDLKVVDETGTKVLAKLKDGDGNNVIKIRLIG